MRIRSAHVLAALLAALPAAPAAATPVGDADLPRIERSLERSNVARVVCGSKTITVEGPRVSAAGLAFRHAIDYPPGRPALIVSGRWDTIAPPPNPMPWTSIERLEAGHRTRGATAAFGAMLGAIVGGVGAAFLSMDDVHGHELEAAGFAAGSIVVGAAFGSLFTTTGWRQIHPAKDAR